MKTQINMAINDTSSALHVNLITVHSTDLLQMQYLFFYAKKPVSANDFRITHSHCHRPCLCILQLICGKWILFFINRRGCRCSGRHPAEWRSHDARALLSYMGSHLSRVLSRLCIRMHNGKSLLLQTCL